MEECTTPRPKRRKKKTIAETREEMAQSGDVDGLWRLLTTSLPIMLDLELTFKLLARALEVRSRQDPAGFASEVFSRLVSFTSYLLLRSHMHASRLLGQYDRSGRGIAELPRELADVVLPRILQLQDHLAEMLALQATTARSWALTRQKEIENRRAAGSQAQPDNPKSQHDASPVVAPLPHQVAEPESPPRGGRQERLIMEEQSDGATTTDLGGERSEDLTSGIPVAQIAEED